MKISSLGELKIVMDFYMDSGNPNALIYLELDSLQSMNLVSFDIKSLLARAVRIATTKNLEPFYIRDHVIYGDKISICYDTINRSNLRIYLFDNLDINDVNASVGLIMNSNRISVGCRAKHAMQLKRLLEKLYKETMNLRYR